MPTHLGHVSIAVEAETGTANGCSFSVFLNSTHILCTLFVLLVSIAMLRQFLLIFLLSFFLSVSSGAPSLQQQFANFHTHFLQCLQHFSHLLLIHMFSTIFLLCFSLV